MALLDATNAQFTFTTLAAFGTSVENAANVCSWLTPDTPHQIRALGSGFTYNGLAPLSGTVTQVTFDLVNKTTPGYGVTDVTVTGIAVPLTALLNPANPAAGEDSFWRTLMAGNDTILAPTAVGGKLVGDFSSLRANVLDPISVTGGNDVFTSASTALSPGFIRGDAGSANALIGDGAFIDGSRILSFVTTAFVQGGNDVFNVSKLPGFIIIGDVQNVGALGIVTGGNDTVNSTINIVSNFRGVGGTYIGDVEINDGLVTGGADVITGSNFAFAAETLVGDVRRNQGTGTTTGGADLLQGRGGQDVIVGDVYFHDDGNVTGGADRISGGGDSDILVGDVLQSIGLQFIVSIPSGTQTQIFTTIDLAGGNDRLNGNDGDDWIVGDLLNGDGIEEPSSIIGGNDMLSGGDGNDMLYGDIGAEYTALLDTGGNDILDGGLGDDLIDGQAGRDTATFASIAAAVRVDVALGTAEGQGSDTLAGIEDVTGSTLDDQILGDSGQNTLNGNAGADILNGRGGNDALVDGAGADRLFGVDGNDVMRLSADGSGDVINGGADADTLDLSGATSSVTVTFAGSLGNGNIAGGGFGADAFFSIEVIAGSSAADLTDTIIGAGGTQVMFLRGGDDVGEGRGGDDLMAGEGGSDRLDGGIGNDVLNGGAGADRFIFTAALDAVTNVDTIEDFDTVADRIELAAGVFSGLAAGSLAASAFASGNGVSTAQDVSDRVIYDTATGALYFDADGTAAGFAAIRFATLANKPAMLSAGDFVVV